MLSGPGSGNMGMVCEISANFFRLSFRAVAQYSFIKASSCSLVGKAICVKILTDRHCIAAMPTTLLCRGILLMIAFDFLLSREISENPVKPASDLSTPEDSALLVTMDGVLDGPLPLQLCGSDRAFFLDQYMGEDAVVCRGH